MKKIILFLGMTAASQISVAAADFCYGTVRSPQIAVEVTEPIRQYDQSLDIESLTSLARKTGASIAPGGVVTGLTTDDRSLSVRVWFDVAPYQDGFCLSPQAKVTLNNRSVVVHMPKEIPADSCFFQATMDHEHKHVHIATEMPNLLLKEEMGKIERSLSSQVGFTQDLSAAQSQIDRIRKQLEEAAQAVLIRVDLANAAIDTEEEYDRVQSICNQRPATIPAAKPWWKLWK